MTLNDLNELLKTIMPNVHHYEASGEEGSFIRWAEDGQGDALYTDNKMQNQTIQGTIDYFTKKEDDPVFNTIQEKLNSADLVWKLNSIQYEKETEYIHYEWVFEIDNPIGGD